MNKVIEELRSKGARFIAVVVQFLNWLALAVGGGLLAVHEMYPNAVADVTSTVTEATITQTLTPTQKLIGLAVWSMVIHFFMRQLKKTV